MSSYKEKSGKNGYEIRADILALAKSAVEHEYNASMEQWELSNGDLEDMPTIPTLETIIAVAQDMYAFVEENSRKTYPPIDKTEPEYNENSDTHSTYYYKQFKKV